MEPRKPSYYSLETKTYEMPDDLVPGVERRVLLLEDDEALAQTLKELLRANRYVVDRVINGAEGLRMILAGDYDVIVCDMVMPNFPGDMFYMAVQRTKPHLCRRFVFTTGHRADPKIDGFLRSIKALALWKPFQPHELLEAMAGVIRKTGTES